MTNNKQFKKGIAQQKSGHLLFMKSLEFYTKKVSIRDLTYPILSNLCNGKNRYNCITDLTLKDNNQINIFIARANELYQKFITQNKTENILNIEEVQLEIYLEIVFCKEYSEPESSGFPLYDFLSFNILEGNQIKSSGSGVMLSSYFHDLEREKIEHYKVTEDDIFLSIVFCKSLFQETYLNGGSPPLKGKKSVFIFPCQNQSNSLKSSTNDYMNYLGFEIDIAYTINGDPLRIFYQSTHPKFDNINLNNGILAIGQVCLEMTRPDIYSGNLELLPFNRENFTEEVKLQQKLIFIKWLNNHGFISAD